MADDETWDTRKIAFLLLALAVIITASLSFFRIGAESMWGDEQNAVLIAKLDIPGILLGQDATHPPGYHLLLHWWMGLVGDGDAALRSLSALFAIASIPAIFLLGRSLWGETEAVLAAFLLSFTQFFIQFAQEARPYTMLVFFGIISSHLLLESIRKRRAVVWYVVTASIGLYLHYFFIFVVGVHALILVAALSRMHGFEARRRVLLFIKLFAPVAGIFGVWAAYKFIPWFILRNPNENLIAWIDRPGVSSFAAVVQALSGTRAVPILAVMGAAAILLVLFVLPAVRQFAEHRRFAIDDFGSELFVFSLMAIPLIATFVISQARPIFLARYLIIVLPFFLLFFARALANLRLKAVMVVCVCAFAIVNVMALAEMYEQPGKEDWRSATKFLLDTYRPGDTIILYNLPQFLATYYAPYGTVFDQQNIGSFDNPENRAVERSKMASYVEGKNRVFLIYTYEFVPNNDSGSITIMDELLAEADPAFSFAERNESFRIIIDVYEMPLIIGGARVEPRSVLTIEPSDFSGRLGERFSGVLPFYGRDDSAHIERVVPSGNYIVTFEARGDPPAPVLLDYHVNNKRGVLSIGGNVSQWRSYQIPFVIEYGLFDLEFTFRNDTYREERGVVVADNAAYIRNVRLINLPGGAQ